MRERKKLILALIGLIVLFLVVLGVGIMWIYHSAADSLFAGGGTLLMSETYEGVSSVETALTAYSVEVAVWDGDAVSVSFYSSGLTDARLPEIRQDGGRLTVQERYRWGGFFSAGKVLVQVPRGTPLAYALHSTSGSVRLDAPAETAELETVSGSIRVWEHGDAPADGAPVYGTLRLRTTSGSIRVYAGAASLTATSTSGSVRAYRPCGTVNLRTVSGSVRAAADGDSGPMQLGTVSGSVRVRFEGDVPGYTLDHSTTSGSVKDEYHGCAYGKTGVDVWGDGSLPVTAATTSGSIHFAAWED